MRTEIAIAVVEHNGQFLVGRRADDVPLGGLFEFPGGKVMAGETPEQAAIRECAEEAGISIQVIDRYFVRDHDYEHGQLKLHFFSCRPIDHSATLRGTFRWVDREQLASMPFPEANRSLIQQLTGAARK